MAKKKINIVLILAVLGLWGTVGYKAVSQYFFSEEIKTAAVASDYNFKARKIERDTFALEKINRDPFLNKALLRAESNHAVVPRAAVSGTRRVVPAKAIEKPKEAKYWPIVSYYGYIKSGSKNELVMLKIGNKMHRLHKGQEVEGLMLNKVFKDSVEVRFNKENKIVRKG